MDGFYLLIIFMFWRLQNELCEISERCRKAVRVVHEHNEQVPETSGRRIADPAIRTESTRTPGWPEENAGWAGGISEEARGSNTTVYSEIILMIIWRTIIELLLSNVHNGLNKHCIIPMVFMGFFKKVLFFPSDFIQCFLQLWEIWRKASSNKRANQRRRNCKLWG